MSRWREQPRPQDAEAVREILASSGFFSAAELDIAVELVNERLKRGLESGYRFLFADEGPQARPIGYTCYGEIPCTVGAYDLYWIAVHAARRGRGLGRDLLAATEEQVRSAGGRKLYIETSGRELYRPTQGFYLGCGYRLEAELPDFYGIGDPKLVYAKAL